MGPIRQAHFSHIDIRTSVAIDVCQQQLVGAVRGEPEHVPAHPPVDIIATVTGAGDQIEAAITGEVDKHTARCGSQSPLPVATMFPFVLTVFIINPLLKTLIPRHALNRFEGIGPCAAN